MIRTRVRKILRDVWARKGRTILVSTAIFIGVTGTIALYSMSDILIGQLKEDIKEDELSMAQIAVVPKEGRQPDDLAYLRRLSAYPGVTEVQAGIEERIVFFKTEEDQQKFEEGFIQAYIALNEDGTALVNVPFEAEARIEPYRLLAGGAWPQPGEVLVERRMADKYGLSVGDQLWLRILSPSRDPQQYGITGTTEAWTISGIVFDPYGFNAAQALFANFDDARYLAGITGINDFWLRFTEYSVAEAQIDQVEDLLAKETAYTPAFTETQDPKESPLITNAQLFANLMGFLALVSLIVSGFLVVNVITSLVTEQKRQIGVMKSMGATRADNFFIYSGIAFMYGLIGVIPGVIVGIPGGNAAAHALSPQLNTVLDGFQYSTSSIVLGVVVGLLVPIVASLLPVYSGTRVQILQAMTDLGIDANYGTGPIARLIGALPIPITVRQGLSNVSLKKSRLAFTVITLSIAVGAFMGIFALFESLTSGIQTFFDSWNIHAGVFPSEPREPDQVISLIHDTLGEDVVVQAAFLQQIAFEGYEPEATAGGPPGIFAYGVDVSTDDPAFRFTLNQGETLTPQNGDTGIILSSLLAANMDKTVGDTVVMTIPGNTKAFTVVGIADFPIEQAWAQWETLALLRDSTIDTIESESPVPAGLIPPEARGFVKYVTAARVAGYALPAGSPLPGVLIMGFTPSVSQFLRFEQGQFVNRESPGVMITTSLAEQSGLGLGDRLTLSSLTPSGITADYPIVGIFEPPTPLQSAGAFPSDFIGMYWQNAIALDGARVSVAPLPGGYFVRLPISDPSVEQVSDALDSVSEASVVQGIAVTGFNFVELISQISDAFFTIQAILSAVAGLIALVGALGLLTTLSMSVYERQKEIGVMRSIGAGSGTVAAQFLTEGLVVGVIAWIVGIPLMILIQIALLQITGFNETFPFQFSLSAVVIGLVGMLIVTAVASLWPSLGAARKTVSDILRYQ